MADNALECGVESRPEIVDDDETLVIAGNITMRVKKCNLWGTNALS